jgi:hypothetical protein
MKSIYFAEMKGNISLKSGNATVALSTSDSSIYTSINGVFGKIILDVTPVDLINIFEDSSSEPTLGEAAQVVQKRMFLVAIEANPIVSGALKYLASHLNFESIESLLYNLDQDSDEISWNSFFELFLLYGNGRESYRPPEGTDKLSRKDVEYLFRLFCFYDSDCDETISRRGMLMFYALHYLYNLNNTCFNAVIYLF